MYLDRVHLKNIKCFPDLEVQFQHARSGSAERSNWNVILGDNGEGKTSLLRAIAACLLDRPAAELCLQPAGWVRAGNDFADLSVDVIPTDEDTQQGPGSKRPHKTVSYTIVEGNTEIPGPTAPRFFAAPALLEPFEGGRPNGRNVTALSKDMEFMKRNAFLREPNRGWLCCAFGAFRRLSGAARPPRATEDPLVQRVKTLFDENAVLTDCDVWLKELDRRAAKSGSGSPQQRALLDVKEALCQILPHVDEVAVGDDVELRFRGARFRVGDLSDGYRSMFGLTIDLLRWIEWARPDAKQALREMRGVVLIDEVDAHLHPRWQREVGFALTHAFPNLQFIVTSHSAFVAMAAGEGAVTVLEQGDRAVKAQRNVPDVRGWAVDRVLTEVFALPSLRDPETTRELARYQELRLRRGAGRLGEGEGTELEALEEKLSRRSAPDVRGSWALEQDLDLLAERLRAKRGDRDA